jgi:putative MATE family efflux protein
MHITSPQLQLIISRTLPLAVGVFAIMMVQLVDTVFIGRLGVNELTTQGITLPFYTIIIGVQVGIGVAVTCIISRAAGAGDQEAASVTASISTLFGVVFISMLSLFFWALSDQILALFITDASASQRQAIATLFSSYWPFWLASAIAGALLYLVSAVYRANEDTKTPGYMLVVASIINLVLDPLLIFTFDLGIKGAALASLAAFSACVVYQLYKARHNKWFAAINACPRHLAYFVALFRMVIPTTANQILPSVSAFLTMLLIANLGTQAIAFWSLLTRMETFMLVLSLSLTMSVPPIIGRYLGEGNQHAVKQLLFTTAKFQLSFHVLVALIIAAASSYLAPYITPEASLQSWMEFALWIIPFSYGPLGLCMVVVSAFNAIGLPKKALVISSARLFLFYLPAVFIGTHTGNITYTVVAATIANLLAGLNAWLALRKHLSDHHAESADSLVGSRA